MNPSFTFSAQVWQYPGQAAWHFITLPVEIATEIRDLVGTSPRGFGSIRVLVKIGQTNWKTSIFPDAKSKSFLLPIKKEIRKTESIQDGDSINISLELLDLLAIMQT